MKGYSGSIAASEGAIALTSAPAGVVMFFDRMGQHRATFQRADISGASANGMGFMASDGHGAIWACGPQDMQLLSQKATLWDKHLKRFAFDPVHRIKCKTQHSQRRACLGIGDAVLLRSPEREKMIAPDM